MAALAGDWPQWRGPERDGGAPNFEPPGTWPTELELVWENPVGHSDASPVIAGTRVFVFVRVGEEEVVKALELGTGEEHWSQSYPAPHRVTKIVAEHAGGPYATPALAGDLLFTYGITEILSAWRQETGELVWQKNFAGQFKRPIPLYGNSLSPLVAGDRLIIHAGGAGDGAVIALNPQTGEELWRLQRDGPAYASPQLVQLDGVEQLLMPTQTSVIGLDPEQGSLLWEFEYKVAFDTIAVSPAVHGNRLIIGAFQRPIEAYTVERVEGEWTVEPLWSNDAVELQFSSPVLVGDTVFAFSMKKKGQFVLLDAETGELLWEGEGRLGENAFLVRQGDVVLGAGDDGVVRAFRIEGTSVELLASYEVAQSSIWNHPALLSQHLMIKDWEKLSLWRVPPGAAPGS